MQGKKETCVMKLIEEEIFLVRWQCWGVHSSASTFSGILTAADLPRMHERIPPGDTVLPPGRAATGSASSKARRPNLSNPIPFLPGKAFASAELDGRCRPRRALFLPHRHPFGCDKSSLPANPGLRPSLVYRG